MKDREQVVGPDGASKLLSGLERRVARWRTERDAGKGCGLIPADIWDDAVAVARVAGVSRTSTRLRMSFYDLKDRVAAAERRDARVTKKKRPSVPALAGPTVATFVELAPIGARESVAPTARVAAVEETSPRAPTLELVGARGERMRISGIDREELAGLVQAFWRRQA